MVTTSADPTVSRRETVSLIGSDKVEGTPVYGRDERKIGMLQRVMIDKISGKVAFAVISFGGFLGIERGLLPRSVGSNPRIRRPGRAAMSSA